jgi:arsenate reductase-like glutaredoxin family protein
LKKKHLLQSLYNEKKTNQIDYEKEYHYYKERCTKLETAAKWLRELKTKNQKLEAEILQYQKGSSTSGQSEKLVDLERKYSTQLLKRENIIKALKKRIQEVRLESEVLREQITEQNKLIDKLENGLQIALDQIDYLTEQQQSKSPASHKPSAPSKYEEEDINYDDLDEATLLKLISQTKQALLDKRNTLKADDLPDFDSY